MFLSYLKVLRGEGKDRGEWISFLEYTPGREVFAHPAYLELFSLEGQKPLCILYESIYGQLLYPFLLRSIPLSEFNMGKNEILYDVITPPYGYGGPFYISVKDREKLTVEFFKDYNCWLNSIGAVSEYTTFTPKQPGDWAQLYPGQVGVKLPVVVRNLDISKEDIWADYKKSVRRDVRKAHKNKITFAIDAAGEYAGKFLDIYRHTMHKHKAESRHNLDYQFISELKDNLKGYFVFFYALENNEIISTELSLISGDSVYAFKGGTYTEKLKTRASPFLTHHIINWCREQGIRFYILGGGNQGEDSLFQHKRGFAPRGVVNLQVGRWVINRERYDRLVRGRQLLEREGGREWDPPKGYFPEYRALSQGVT